MYMVLGVMHPRPINDAKYNGPRIKEEEADRILADFIDKPVLVEHSGPPIGKVLRFSRAAHDSILAHLLIDSRLPGAAKAIEGLRNNVYNGLSLGQGYSITPDYKYFLNKRPKEVSIVQRGAIGGSHIIGHGDKSDIRVNMWAVDKIAREDESAPAKFYTGKLRIKMEAQSDTKDVEALATERDLLREQVQAFKEAEKIRKEAEAARAIQAMTGMMQTIGEAAANDLNAPQHGKTIIDNIPHLIGKMGAQEGYDFVVAVASLVEAGKKQNSELTKKNEELQVNFKTLEERYAQATKQPPAALETQAERKRPRESGGSLLVERLTALSKQHSDMLTNRITGSASANAPTKQNEEPPINISEIARESRGQFLPFALVP